MPKPGNYIELASAERAEVFNRLSALPHGSTHGWLMRRYDRDCPMVWVHTKRDAHCAALSDLLGRNTNVFTQGVRSV